MVFFRRKKKEDITPLSSINQDLSEAETVALPNNTNSLPEAVNTTA